MAAELILMIVFLAVMCAAPVLAIALVVTAEMDRRNRPVKSREAE